MMLLILVDRRVEERQMVVYTKEDKLLKKQWMFNFFIIKINIYLPKTGVDKGCSMEWNEVDGWCCAEFVTGMFGIFSSWWNIVLSSLSNAILDQSAAPGVAAWVWEWWVTEVFVNSNKEYDHYHLIKKWIPEICDAVFLDSE